MHVLVHTKYTQHSYMRTLHANIDAYIHTYIHTYIHANTTCKHRNWLSESKVLCDGASKISQCTVQSSASQLGPDQAGVGIILEQLVDKGPVTVGR